jgi:hypothetical protein
MACENTFLSNHYVTKQNTNLEFKTLFGLCTMLRVTGSGRPTQTVDFGMMVFGCPPGPLPDDSL